MTKAPIQYFRLVVQELSGEKIKQTDKQTNKKTQFESYSSGRFLWRKPGFHECKKVNGDFREVEQTEESCIRWTKKSRH